ncbi:MAG: tRNA (adenosine(37)-N6)-threonylcarbamoyltransferase complex dimerization subunit type 1 TsaB [Flavobacteriales bacterium]
MSKLLCIETSTKNCSVALSLNGKVVVKEEHDANNFIHQERLHPLVQALLSEHSVALSEIDAFAISLGPGSYTGLRIGVSAVKGFAFAMAKPVIAVPTLYHMARGCQMKFGNFKNFYPMIDARRMEVYSAEYSEDIALETEVKAVEIDEDSYASTKSNSVFFGDGAEKLSEVLQLPIEESPQAGSIIRNFQASASDLAVVAKEWYDQKRFVDLAYFEPYYHKDFVAGLPKKIFQ